MTAPAHRNATARDWIWIQPVRPSMAHVAKEVAERHGITVADLKGRSQYRDVCRARHECMSIMKTLAGRSYSEIGRFLGRDHASVIHGVRVHAARQAG